MSSTLTPRGRCLRWHSDHAGITEDPPGSNSDRRTDGIRHAQITVARGSTYLVGLPWCGVWACMGARAGGVKIPRPERWAGVANIEDDAKAKTNGFRGWTLNPKAVLRGDLVVLFGRGVHVETVRQVFTLTRSKRFGWVLTNGGNTGSDNAGDQANGGGAFRRWRRLSDVYGFALVDFPDA